MMSKQDDSGGSVGSDECPREVAAAPTIGTRRCRAAAAGDG
eukprot:SAG11_NODE_10544_length_823_cov_0.805249_2_plen_41_part_00